MTSASATATIRLGVELSDLQKGLQKAATLAEEKGQSIKAGLLRATDSGVQGFKEMGGSIASALNPINLVNGALGSMTATLGLGAGAAGLGGLIAAAIASADSMADLSIKTGIQVEQLSRFSSVAKLSGTSMDEVAHTVKKLSISAVDAYSGNDKLARSFDAIGISTKELKNISPDELLIRVAQGIQGIDPMIVQDLMAQLGGRGAQNVLPFLRELTERIDETSVKISTEFAKDAKDFNDNITLLKGGVIALSRNLAADLLPSINAVLSGMLSGEGIIRSFMAAMTVDWNGGNLKAQLDKEKTDLKTLKDSLTDNEDFLMYEEHLKRRELRIKLLEDRISATSKGLNPDIDPAKNEAARRAAAENNKSGASAGDGFLKGLQDRIKKADEGEYAMLRLQAAEKGVSIAAGPLIDQLKKLDEAKSVANYEQGLQRQNTEIEFQNSLIGKSAAEVAMLNVERKMELDLAKQIEQIERSKGALSADSIAQMQAATEASIAIQQASISSRIQLEKNWQNGASTSLQKYLDNAENVAKGTEDAFTRAFKGVEDAFVSLAMTGSASFTNLTNSVIADILRMQARAATAGLMNFLGQTLGNMFAGSVSGTGYTSASPSGAGTYNYAGSEMVINTVNADGNVFSGAPSLSAYSNTVQTKPTLFNYSTLHRFAKGGIFAEENPEAVMPLTRMGNGKLGVQSSGSGAVNITVNNNGNNAQATANDRGTDGFGIRQIEIMITDVVAKGLVSGRLDTAMQGAFNLRRAGK
ncbi:phage tail tape measure C-terminal domain-containing protein [Flavobacterium sp.]|jgi:lambda family phage tail tape measure protein|uniref:phage tail tape measure C-terminal domain-containing protein n=1 Tax=Flavobacterium sp. TaxID=239 RepID=UPI0037C04BA1